MSVESTLFGRDSALGRAANIIGLGIPNMLEKAMMGPEAKGPRLGEISQQTAKESEPRVIVWGRVRPIGGNLIHCQEPIKRMVKEDVESGGKGGNKKKTQKVEHVYRTYALGVCEGPITAYARIWRNNKLVYDARGNAWGRKNNGVFLKNYRIYLGLWTQMPSPELEAIWGAGNVPAYRGTAYLVAVNEDLTDQSGAVPQWLFEVERAEGYPLTSRPYAVEDIEAVQSDGSNASAPWQGYTEAIGSSGVSIPEGSLRNILRPVAPPPEGMDSTGSTITGATLRTVLKVYNIPVESVDSKGLALEAATLRTALITYAYTPENLDSGGLSIAAGSLI